MVLSRVRRLWRNLIFADHDKSAVWDPLRIDTATNLHSNSACSTYIPGVRFAISGRDRGFESRIRYPSSTLNKEYHHENASHLSNAADFAFNYHSCHHSILVSHYARQQFLGFRPGQFRLLKSLPRGPPT